MVAWYIRQIKMGRMTLDDVPKKWKAKVENALKEK